MNFDKRYNEFSGIPGFDASKGEGIAKALQRLWIKMKDLERTRSSERKSSSKKTEINSSDGDLTMADVQYQLFVLQLRYVRSILKKKREESALSHSKMFGDLSSHMCEKNNNKILILDRNHTKETQTGNSLIENQNYNSSYAPISANEIENQIDSDNPVFPSKDRFYNSAPPSFKNIHCKQGMLSKPHYHLKLDDVPFILGASSTASHSVVANVQNIIAQMKSHNRVLCGPKHNTSRLPAPKIHSSTSDSQDVTEMCKELSQGLCELALKQEKLGQMLDVVVQGKEQSSNYVLEDKRRISKPANRTKVTTRDNKRNRSNSESALKLQAEKDIPNYEERDTLRSGMQQKPNRRQPSNLSIMDRRKLLRSLRNFKTRLSEEDISWD